MVIAGAATLGAEPSWQATPPPPTPPPTPQAPLWAAPSPGLIGSTVTSRPQTPPAARTQPGPTYDASDCVHLSTDCGGFNRATAIPKSSSFNLGTWIGHQFRAHWRGMVQTGVFIGCLATSMVTCLAAEGIGIGIDYFANGMQYGFTSRKAWEPAARSLVIDTLSIPFGYAATRVLDQGIFSTSGLLAAEEGDINGTAGRFFGSYAPYIPRHASDFVGYNQAVQFFVHPSPVIAQVGGRSAVNLASCNGGDVENYC